MAFDYINEAFKKLDLLEEQLFHASADGVNSLNDFLSNSSDDEVVRVIDPEVTTSEELSDSYVGKVIINCNVCHSHVFENKEDITISEEGVVNVETQCPFCGETEGFVIVGEIAPFNAETATPSEEEVEEPADEEPVEDISVDVDVDDATEDDQLEESFDENPDENVSVSRATRHANKLSEDFKEVSITTEDQHMEMTSDENGKVTVTTEPVENMEPATEETIAPLSVETETEIFDNNEETVAEPSNEETIDEISFEDEESDLEIDEVDEAGMDELGESYLRNVYENVSSFKTTNVSTTPTQLIVEGVITFTSGATKNTGFMFESHDINDRGQVRFIGTNKQLTESATAYSLVGRVDNKKLFVESLKYNYSVNDNAIRGVVRRK